MQQLSYWGNEKQKTVSSEAVFCYNRLGGVLMEHDIGEVKYKNGKIYAYCRTCRKWHLVKEDGTLDV